MDNQMAIQSAAIPHDATILLCRVGELWLKGRNQKAFVERLKQNLRAVLKSTVGTCKIKGQRGHLFIHLPEGGDLDAAIEACVGTPGLSSVSPVIEVEPDLDVVKATAVKLARAALIDPQMTYAVKSKRLDKSLPFTSTDLNQYVGGAVHDVLQPKVNLKNPDHTLGVELGEEHAHLWIQNHPAAGGLPVGVSGRAMLMLSGGIDSPVAGYLAQKRGCSLDAIYFHSPPFISEASREKVIELGRTLAKRQDGMNLHVIPFTEIQKAIKAHCDPRMTVILYRRFMYRIAAKMAQKKKCRALCTGENLAQVASQTLENLQIVDQVTPLITLRPLIAFDKDQIVRLARKIGTFDTSVLPYDDCCTLFVPKYPVTRAKPWIVDSAEQALEIDALVDDAIHRAETVRLDP